jgi:hypothetical protein
MGLENKTRRYLKYVDKNTNILEFISPKYFTLVYHKTPD